MTALIVWACIIGYIGAGAALHSKFALAQFRASKGKYYSNKPSEAAGYAALQSLIWPVYFIIWRSTGLIYDDIELQEEMKKVRERITEQKRLERTRAQIELAEFDRRMRETE